MIEIDKFISDKLIELQGRDPSDPELKAVLSLKADAARWVARKQFEGAPEFTTEVSPYSNKELEKRWEDQVKRLIEIGVHKALNMTEAEYIESLPKFTEHTGYPKSKYSPHAEFTEPVIIETRIPFAELAKLSGMSIMNLHPEDFPDNPAFTVVDAPYVAWFERVQPDMNPQIQYRSVVEDKISFINQFEEGEPNLLEGMNWIMQNVDEWVTYCRLKVPLVDEGENDRWIEIESKFGKTEISPRYIPVEF